MLVGQFREMAVLNDGDITGGVFNTSAYRERGKAKLSSFKEAWEKMLLMPPPDLVPMWDQIEDSGDLCGFMVTTKNLTNWRIASHGSLRLNEQMLTKRHSSLSSCTSAKFTQRNGVHAVRLPKNTEGSAEKSGAEMCRGIAERWLL